MQKKDIIKLVCVDCDFSKLKITIDKTPVKYSIDQNIITVESDLPFGLHYLELSLVEGEKISFKEIYVNSESLRMMLYLSWLIDTDGKRWQPATTIWEKNQTWVLPFGNPVSWWYSLVYTKLPNNTFGTDLHQNYDILWPDAISIPDSFPATLKTFFWNNFDFYCKPKRTGNPPWYELDFSLDRVLVDNCVQEIESNIEWIFENRRHIGQDAYNAGEFTQYSERQRWHGIDLIDKKKNKLYPGRLSNLYKLIDSIPSNDIGYGYLGILPPGGFIIPHLDDSTMDRSKIGPYNIYIPLQWNKGNYFKFSSAGLLPSGKNYLINPSGYTHALINNSDSPRYILTFMVDINKVQHLIRHAD